jgi:hypothetical protein
MAGLSPDFLFCRSTEYIKNEALAKLSLFGGVTKDHVRIVSSLESLGLQLTKYRDHKPGPIDHGETISL